MKSAHEPDALALLNLILQLDAGRIDQAVFSQLVSQVIQRQGLVLNVSQINGFIVETLYGLYPTARYVLTIRDCRSWVRSFVNHQVKRPVGQGRYWHGFRQLRFRPDEHPYRPEDRVLEAGGLYSLDAYLSYWLWHNSVVLKTVPVGQLLVTPTLGLTGDGEPIARFLGIDPGQQDPERLNEFRGRYVTSPLDEMDQAYLADRIGACTQALIEAAGDRLPEAVTRYLVSGERA